MKYINDIYVNIREMQNPIDGLVKYIFFIRLSSKEFTDLYNNNNITIGFAVLSEVYISKIHCTKCYFTYGIPG